MCTIITKETVRKLCNEYYEIFGDEADYISCVYYVLESLGLDKYGEYFEAVEKYCI